MSAPKCTWRECVEEIEASVVTNVDALTGHFHAIISLLPETDDDATIVNKCCEAANNIMNDSTATSKDKIRLRNILQFMHYAGQARSTMKSAFNSFRLLSSTETNVPTNTNVDEELLMSVAKFSPMDIEKVNCVQSLIMYILNCLQSVGYRRHCGECYGMLVVDGIYTHAWQRVCSIKDFIYQHTKKELNFDMWMALTRVRTNLSAVVEHLSQCHDVQFMDLKRDRHVFSFRNGIYFAKEDAFKGYDAVSEDVISAKFFDLDFPKDDDSKNIETPLFQSILDYQKFPEDVCVWMYVFIGRLIYEVGELDRWQVIPYLKGAASSGKSTILTHVCKSIFDQSDVGVLSNNIEKKFGLYTISDKLMFIAPEIKSDISLEQAEFQSMVSGESLQLAVKFAPSQTVTWVVPGILAGNEVPSWVDNSGSINRRIVLFDFERSVVQGDMMLGKKLAGEMAKILVKSNRAYLDAVRKYAQDNIWRHLPESFHNTKDDLSESVNSMVSFLRNGQLTFETALYMPYLDFVNLYQSYCKQIGQRTIMSSEYRSHLTTLGCTIIRNTTLKYPRNTEGATYLSNTKFIMGVDILTSSSS